MMEKRIELTGASGFTFGALHVAPVGARKGGLVLIQEIFGINSYMAAAARMQLPLVADAEHGVWALGPWPGTGRALVSAEAADLALPDLHGNEFRLSSLRGRKALLLSWAPY